jgi:WD40 repeat protein/DNA-binding SARP family transcriptional activator
MSRLTLTLFQTFQAERADHALRFRTAHTKALLAYLAVEHERPHSRSSLAGLLWPDQTNAAAAHNLSQTLVNLRSSIGDRAATPPFLQISKLHIQLNRAAAIDVDVIQFQHAYRQSQQHAHSSVEHCHECLAALQSALDRYCGPLLADFTLNSELFEEWLTITREHLQRQALQMFDQLINGLIHQQNYQLGLAYAQQLVQLDPLNEAAQRRFIQLLALSNQRSSALQQFAQYRDLLARELDLPPEDETLALVEQVRAGLIVPADAAAAVASVALAPPTALRLAAQAPLIGSQMIGELPEIGAVYGRHRERERLHTWLVADHCRMLLLLGMGGIGKTTLAIDLAQRSAEHFTHVIWKSLLNAPTLDDLLIDLFQQLAPELVASPGQSLDRRLDLLLSLLRQSRCLLILDNYESLLRGETLAGGYREGYATYEQLLHRLGQSGHQSCVLITSREQPANIDRLMLSSPLVRSLRLGGLDAAAGEEVLAAAGLNAAAAAEHAELVARYSGNPLALKLAAVAVLDLFAGDAHAFLHQESMVFDDVRLVIEQQFSRLSEVEQALMRWLAIEREPLSLQHIHQHCMQQVTPRRLIEAIRSLQRRSLLDEQHGRFTLPNVVMEYVTDSFVEAISAELRQRTPRLLAQHALMRAQSKTYLRQTQQRLFVLPIATLLQTELGVAGFLAHCRALLDELRTRPYHAGYTAGALLNLLVALNYDLTCLDCSQLAVREAMLQGVIARHINFQAADLRGTLFTESFEGSYALALHPDGEQMVTGTTTGGLRFWSTSDWQPLGYIGAHPVCVWAVAYSRDGNLLASGSEDPVVQLWNGRTGAYLHSLSGHRGPVRGLAFSPDGTLLASVSLDQEVRLWQTRAGTLHAVLTRHEAMVRGVAFSPDGRFLVTSGDDALICVWEVASGTLLHVLREHIAHVFVVAFSPDGQTLASGSYDGTVRFWDGQHFCLRQTIHAHQEGVRTLVYRGDGRIMATSGFDQTIRLWDVASGQLLNGFERQNSWIRSLAFSRDGSLLVSCQDDHTLLVWDVARGQVVRNILGFVNWVHGMAVSPTGTTVASVGNDQVVRLWDFASPDRFVDLRAHRSVLAAVAFSPDGQQIASGGQDQTVLVWDVAKQQPTLRFQAHGGFIYTISFHPDGRRIASGGVDRAALLWDAATGTIQRAFQGPGAMINCVAFHPAGRLIALVGDHPEIIIADVESGAPVVTLAGHQAEIRCVSFSPDGTTLASSSYDGTVRLWDVGTWRERRVLEGHEATASTVAFSPDGTLLASGSLDLTVRIWDVASGQCRHVLRGHTSSIMGVGFSSQGARAVSSSYDETLREWDVNSGACLVVRTMPRPYAGMQISGVSGISAAQRASLRELGAVE